MTQRPAEFRAARVDRGALAGALGLSVRDLGDPPAGKQKSARAGKRNTTRAHNHGVLPVEFVSTGISHLLVPLRNRALLGRIDVDPRALRRVMGSAGTMAYCFALGPRNTVYARGMLPWQIGEDAATGSAAGSLAAYLVRHERLNLATPLEIHQGLEMGRPSNIRVEVLSERGKFVPRVSGSAVTIMEGFLEI